MKSDDSRGGCDAIAALTAYCRADSAYGELFSTLSSSSDGSSRGAPRSRDAAALAGSDDGRATAETTPAESPPLTLSELHAMVDGVDEETLSAPERECAELAASIRASVNLCDRVLEQIQSSRGSLTRMSAQHASVSLRAKALHTNTTALLAERERLHNAVAKISTPLAHFDEVARISLMLGLKPLDGARASDVAPHKGSKAIDSTRPEDFWPIHQRICECVDYLEAHPSFVDSARYLGYFASLERKGLQLSRDKVVRVIEREAAGMTRSVTAAHARVAAATKMAAADPNGPGGVGANMALADEAQTNLLAEMPILDARFRAALAPLRSVVVNLETRAQGGGAGRGSGGMDDLSTPASDTLSSAAPPQRRGNSVARDMLSECEARYCGCRRKLLEVVVPLRLEAARRQCLGGSGKLTSSLRASGGSGAVRAPRPAKGEAAAGGGNSSSLGMLPPSAAGSGTPAVLRLLRVSCAYLISVCETERSTYGWLFGSGDGGGGGGVGGRAKLSAAAALVHIAAAETRGISLPLSPMPSVQLDPTRLNTYIDNGSAMASTLYDMLGKVCISCYASLRSPLIKLTSIELLGDIVHVLRDEVLVTPGKFGGGVATQLFASSSESGGGGGAGRLGSGSGWGRRAPYTKLVKRLIADVQERLSFQGQRYLQAQIRHFEPSAFDLAYPRKLDDFERARRLQARMASEQPQRTDDGGAPDVAAPLSQRAVWYPPLVRTLEFLARIYLNVDNSIFEEMAQEAVSACTTQFKHAASLIAKQQSSLDGQLFLLKHLLALREQISPFELDFVATERSLERGSSAMPLPQNWLARQFMRGRRAMGAPRVKVTLIDSKKQLEGELKAACDGFIALATQLAVGPLLALLRDLGPWTAAQRGLGRGRKPPQLRLQKCGNPARVAAVLADVRARMAESLGLLLSQMRAYLDNTVTQTILYRPVRNAIASGTAEVESVITTLQGYSQVEVDAIAAALRIVEAEALVQEKEIAGAGQQE